MSWSRIRLASRGRGQVTQIATDLYIKIVADCRRVTPSAPQPNALINKRSVQHKRHMCESGFPALTRSRLDPASCRTPLRRERKAGVAYDLPPLACRRNASTLSANEKMNALVRAARAGASDLAGKGASASGASMASVRSNAAWDRECARPDHASANTTRRRLLIEARRARATRTPRGRTATARETLTLVEVEAERTCSRLIG